MRKFIIVFILLLIMTPVLDTKRGITHPITTENLVFLPVLPKNYYQSSIFGVEFKYKMGDSQETVEKISQVIPTWTRLNGLLWSDVSPNDKSERKWEKLAYLETKIQETTQRGMIPIIVIRSTPNWAQAKPGYFCGPIKSDTLADFATFLTDLVTRYSVSPYNVKYWELWNEPDIDPTAVLETSQYGCWGDETKTYYGGEYYAEMLEVAYPAIKAADPDAQVLVGGLLLDCDPRNPPAGKTCVSSKFLEGILRAGGGNYFDGISFHAYDYYGSSLGYYTNSNWHTAWNSSGPVTAAKVDYLNSLMNDPTFGVSGKYLMNTETAVLCDTCVGNNTYESTKAYYIAQSYAQASMLNLKANVWYSATGWRTSGLLDDNLNPLPAYHSYAFARQEIGTAIYNNMLSQNVDGDLEPDITFYDFERGNQTIRLLWSLDGDPHTITLPTTPNAAYDVYGNPLVISGGNTWNVTIAPIYLEWPK